MDQGTEQLSIELGKLRDKALKKRFLTSHPEILERRIVEELTEAVRAAVRVDVPRALALAEAALAIAEELNDEESLARGLRARGNALWFKGDCKSAVEMFQEAAAGFEHVGNRNEVGRTLSSSIQSLLLLGDYDAAFQAAERARQIFASLGELWRIARLEINVANIYHRQNRFAEALASYQCAYEQLLPHRDTEGIGVALHNMAVCQIALDDFEGALDSYRRLRDVCQQYGMPLLGTQADYNIAYLYYLRGDYTKALELLRATRETCQKNGDTYHLGLCDLDQSEIYLELSLIQEAEEMAHNSFAHFEQHGMGFEAARALTNLAIATSLEGDYPRALDLFARAKEMMSREKNQAWPFLIDLYSAVVLIRQSQFAAAHALCESALSFFRSAALPSKHALCLLLVARTSLRTSNLEDSTRCCEQALAVLTKVDAPILTYQVQLLRGEIYEAVGDSKRAYGSYQKARSALETLRTSLQKEELKIGFMRNRLEVYSRLIRLCLDSDSTEASVEEAFLYIEAAKSRTLQDLIIGGAPPRERSEDTKTDQRVRELRRQLNWYYHRMEREQLTPDQPAGGNLESLKLQAQAREHELEKILLEAPGAGRVGAALRNSSPIALDHVRGVLGSDAALLEYFSLEDRIFAAVLTAKRIDVVPLAHFSSVGQHLRMLQFQFSKFRLDRTYVERFREPLMRATQSHLQSLFEILIGPIKHLLTVRDLVIIPSGALHALPFHALHNGDTYLIDAFSVCYAPSASVFAYCHRDSVPPAGRPLILGIEDSKTPFIPDEIRAVASALSDSEVLVGADATEQALREKGASSRIIHIASHGYFRQDSPMFSAVRLADSYVNLYDLYHMNLPADLLTLSGCVTGLNVIEEGDELLGLTRGLLYAGARSLVLSLWDVDDRSTSEFMGEFYSRIGSGTRKADALRDAMTSVRERYPHPYYWAPFKLLGKALTA
jgi:CHAT domain-containing protein